MAGGAAADPVNVLVVEDDPGDVLMISEAFQQAEIRSQLHVVSDGEEALSFLRQADDYPHAPRPRLILLDLNMPGRNGVELLAALKADEDLLTIPVVVLTSSRAPEDIRRCYSLHANAYITKPADFDGFSDVIQQITGCFLRLIELPS